MNRPTDTRRSVHLLLREVVIIRLHVLSEC
jgi:hypothetical protein